MPFDFSKTPDTYEVVFSEYIDELKSECALLRHKKTGARVTVISNDDSNKVFNIGFRTPPENSTGVAHIMEHTVLCGSEKFPAKDPFVELCKGSLNTFLNAMTYPDKTIYPVASYNDTDFQNLMHVYLDAVFHPNIYYHEEIFRQEGWHYELEDKDAPVIYNGVVYNEMKGAFSAPEQVLYRRITETLFPDTIYSVESGGDPEVIPELTYEEYLDFHRKFYHPSNSYIYLYGDLDVTEKLNFINDEYLSHYDYLEVDSQIGRQDAFEAVSYSEYEYPVGEEDDEEDASYMAFNWVVGDALDPELYYAFQILEYALMEAPGSPLKEALLAADLGEDIYGFFDTGLIQPYLSIVIKNMNPDNRDMIIGIINGELRKLADEGLNRRTILGALNYFEFKSREGDYGRWPKGLMIGLQMLESWLYDDEKPFIHLKYQPVYDSLREKLETGYFEQLIRTYLLDNTHASVMILKPSKGLAIKKEKELADKLAAFKASLNEEDIEKLIADTAHLKAYQSEPSPKEVIEMIPLLSISDIKKEAEPLINRNWNSGRTQFLHHDIETNAIDYITLIFDIHRIEPEELPYAAVLAEALGGVNTEHYSYQELNDEINLNTGGIKTDTNLYGAAGTETYKPVFEVCGKVLAGKIKDYTLIIEEMLMRSDFSDERRIRDILNRIKSRLEMSLLNNGHSTAINRVVSYFNESGWFRELTEGIAFYQFVADILKDYDVRKTEVKEHLERLMIRIFREENLLADLTCSSKCFDEAVPEIDRLTAGLYKEPLTDNEKLLKTTGTCPTHNEAFTTNGMVQFNACAGNFTETGIVYSGSMNVLRNILGNEYLWNNVRVKGGAYGCMCNFGITGNAYFVSYRDPNLASTYEVYAQAADYVAGIELDERERTKYIIGAIGTLDIPMTPVMKGSRSLAAWLAKRTYEDIQKSRDELLGTTAEDLRNLAPAVRCIADAGHYCTVGSESQIAKEKDRFEHLTPLIR